MFATALSSITWGTRRVPHISILRCGHRAKLDRTSHLLHYHQTTMQLQPTDALLVIDVQNDFMPGGALAIPDGDAIVPLINTLAKKFDHVILTQDWHPAQHISFASTHPNKNPFETIQVPYGPQVLWPAPVLQNTE